MTLRGRNMLPSSRNRTSCVDGDLFLSFLYLTPAMTNVKIANLLLKPSMCVRACVRAPLPSQIRLKKKALKQAGRQMIFIFVCEQWRTERGGGVGGFKHPPKFRRPSKIVPNSTRLWKLLKIAEFRTSTAEDVREKGSKILKLPSVRNCFTLAMKNKLVVIINSLKVTKIKKLLLYEMKFLVPNYSCLQNPWLGGYCPQIPVLSVLNWICWNALPPEQNSWVRHCSLWVTVGLKENDEGQWKGMTIICK